MLSSAVMEESDTRDSVTRPAARLPLDVLARDWLKDESATNETRLFLTEQLLPTLILGNVTSSFVHRIRIHAQDSCLFLTLESAALFRHCCATSRQGVALSWFDTACWLAYIGQFPGGGNIFILHRGQGSCSPNFD